MDQIIAKIAVLSVMSTSLFAGPPVSAVLADATPAVRTLFRRIPPVDMMRRIPPVESLPGGRDRMEEWGRPTPAMRPLPDVDVEESAAPDSRETVTLRRLPAVADEEVIDSRRAVPSNYSDDWKNAAGALGPVGEQSRRVSSKGFELAERGAFYSARAEFIEALRGIALGLDSHYGSTDHTDSLLAALRALKEADDFSALGSRLEVPIDVASTAAAHRTKLSTATDLTNASPVYAMQQYYAFAQEKLAAATGGGAVASEPLYGLGKVHMALARQAGDSQQMQSAKAMVFFAAALQIDPSHGLAANELGVMYARLGRLQEARRILQQSVTASQLEESWQNLASVHEWLGEAELAAAAMAQANQIARERARPQVTHGVEWVSPGAFAGLANDLPAAGHAPVFLPAASRPVSFR